MFRSPDLREAPRTRRPAIPRTSSPRSTLRPPRSSPPLDATAIDGDAVVTLPDRRVLNCDEDNGPYAKVGSSRGRFECNDKTRDVRPHRGFKTLTPIVGRRLAGRERRLELQRGRGARAERQRRCRMSELARRRLCQRGIRGNAGLRQHHSLRQMHPDTFGRSKTLDTTRPVACK